MLTWLLDLHPFATATELLLDRRRHRRRAGSLERRRHRRKSRRRDSDRGS